MVDVREFDDLYRVRTSQAYGAGDHSPFNYEIRCKYGLIQPWDDAQLAATILATDATTHTCRSRLKRLKATGLGRMTQEGTDEGVFVFSPDHLKTVGAIMGVRRRRHLSPDVRKAATKRLIRARIASEVASGSLVFPAPSDGLFGAIRAVLRRYLKSGE